MAELLPQGAEKQSYLTDGINAVLHRVAPSTALHDEYAHYIGEAAKTACFFAGGKFAFGGAVLLQALDEASPADTKEHQVEDLVLGSMKGYYLKRLFSGNMDQTVNPAWRGVKLGIGSRFIDTGLTRQNWQGAQPNSFSFRSGLNAFKRAESLKTIASDAIIFGAAGSLFKGLNGATNGAIERSRLAATVLTGTTLGLSSGAGHEILREAESHETFSLTKIVKRAGIEAAIDSVAAVPAAVQFRGPNATPVYEPTRTTGPNDNKFVSESVSWKEFNSSRKVGMSATELSRVKGDINNFGRDPKAMLVEAMQNNRVLGMGENHLTINPHEEFGATIMEALKSAGATHMAIEVPGARQHVIDALDPNGPAGKSASYYRLMKSARDAGLKIVGVDSDRRLVGDNTGRNQAMAENIDKILQDPSAKVVFWVGAEHLERSASESSVVSAAEILRRQGHSVFTVNEESDVGIGTLARLTGSLNQPVGIPTQDADFLRQMRKSGKKELEVQSEALKQSDWLKKIRNLSKGGQYGAHDAVIAYPWTGTSKITHAMQVFEFFKGLNPKAAYQVMKEKYDGSKQ